MLPRGLATSAILCALSTVLAPGVRGADFRIPTPAIRTTPKSHPIDTLQKTTGNSHTVDANNATVNKGSGSVQLYNLSTMLSRAKPTQTPVPSASVQWFTGYQKIEPRVTQCCDDNTSDAATQTLSYVSWAGKSTDSHERTTMLTENISYEPPSQPLPSLPAGAQVEERLTELLTLPVSLHYLAEISTKIFQPSSTSAPDHEVSLLDIQASAFFSTEREPSDRLNVTFSLFKSIAAGISTSPYPKSSGFGGTAVSFEIPLTEFSSKTNKEPLVDGRPTAYFGTANLATDISIGHHELSSNIDAKTALLPANQSTKLHSTQGDVSSAVGFVTSSPEVQVTETHSIQYEQTDSAKVTALSLKSLISTEKYEPITSVIHKASTSDSHITDSQTEHYTLVFDLDKVISSKETQTVDLSTIRYQQSYGESATYLTFQTRKPELSTNLEERPSLSGLTTTFLLETPDVAAELASTWYPLMPDVETTTASLLNTLATESQTTQHEQSSSVSLSTSLRELQQYQPPDGVNVVPPLFEARTTKRSTERYVLPTSISKTASMSTTQSNEPPAEQSSKFDRTVLLPQTQDTELPSTQEDLSSIHLSIMHTYRAEFAPTKEISTSTSPSITAMAKPASDKIITVIAIVAGSVVLLLIVCGSLLVLTYRAGKTGSFLLPQLSSKDTDRKKGSALTQIGLNHMSALSTNGFENEAFV